MPNQIELVPGLRCDRSATEPTPPSELRLKPELLSPAGDRTCLLAAVENGADAVYFGLRRHNARIRAMNFDGADLAEVMALLHRRGVRGYVTLNTLMFPDELADVETTVRELVVAGVDAVIIQDLGLARLIRAISSDLEMHASTQMSITSEEGIRLAAELGCSRVILARELVARRDPENSQSGPIAGRGLRARRTLRGLFGPVPDQRGAGRPLGEPRRVRPGLPDALRDHLRRPTRGSREDSVSSEPPGSCGLRPDSATDRAGRLQPEDRGPPQGSGVRGQHHPALSPGHRRGLGRAAGRVHPPRCRGDAALVFPRVQPRLPRRQQPQGAGAWRLRQEARNLRWPR